MKLRIGIDVGGTFTDFLVTREGSDPKIFKVLSTPEDPSLGLINGLLVVKTGLHSFIITLGTMYIFRGLLTAWSGGGAHHSALT